MAPGHRATQPPSMVPSGRILHGASLCHLTGVIGSIAPMPTVRFRLLRPQERQLSLTRTLDAHSAPPFPWSASREGVGLPALPSCSHRQSQAPGGFWDGALVPQSLSGVGGVTVESARGDRCHRMNPVIPSRRYVGKVVPGERVQSLQQGLWPPKVPSFLHLVSIY